MLLEINQYSIVMTNSIVIIKTNSNSKTNKLNKLFT